MGTNKSQRENSMGKITEQLSEILKTPKNKLVERVTKLLQSNSTPPANVSLIYANDRLYVNNNFSLFGLIDDQKTELMRCMLNDALNNLKQPESQNNDKLEQDNECSVGCGCYECNNSEILGVES